MQNHLSKTLSFIKTITKIGKCQNKCDMRHSPKARCKLTHARTNGRTDKVIGRGHLSSNLLRTDWLTKEFVLLAYCEMVCPQVCGNYSVISVFFDEKQHNNSTGFSRHFLCLVFVPYPCVSLDLPSHLQHGPHFLGIQ